MKELEIHEIFEMETLDEMRRQKILPSLIFGGGTMLRLCHQLPRYSVDLDFYLKKPNSDFKPQFVKLAESIAAKGIEITDKQEKHRTYLLEMRKSGYPRRLKIEIRKEAHQAKLVDKVVAYSKFAPDLQVVLTACSLAQMWRNKTESLLERQIIRDAYDLEFLIRRGAGNPSDLERERAEKILRIVRNFKNTDFTHSLKPLLPKDERDRLSGNRFILLEGALEEAIKD